MVFLSIAATIENKQKQLIAADQRQKKTPFSLSFQGQIRSGFMNEILHLRQRNLINFVP